MSLPWSWKIFCEGDCVESQGGRLVTYPEGDVSQHKVDNFCSWYSSLVNKYSARKGKTRIYTLNHTLTFALRTLDHAQWNNLSNGSYHRILTPRSHCATWILPPCYEQKPRPDSPRTTDCYSGWLTELKHSPRAINLESELRTLDAVVRCIARERWWRVLILRPEALRSQWVLVWSIDAFL